MKYPDLQARADAIARYKIELANLEHEIAEAAIACYESDAVLAEDDVRAVRLGMATEHLITFKSERKI